VLWYGTDDHRFKPPAGAWLADRLPNARLTIFERTSHLLPLVHWRTLVTELATISQGAPNAVEP
jgi:pimeloyl-ACP methyl ester carboxylesterase